jgi:hypothetical protein
VGKVLDNTGRSIEVETGGAIEMVAQEMVETDQVIDVGM